MEIAYLHLGLPEHGINRYGCLLAAEGHQQDNLRIVECHVNLSENWTQSRAMLLDAVLQLSRADVIHIQYCFKNNKPLWGEGLNQLNCLRLLNKHCAGKLVVTLHDVYDLPVTPRTLLHACQQWLKNTDQDSQSSKSIAVKRVKRLFRYLWHIRKHSADALALGYILRKARYIFVCSNEEAKRLQWFADFNNIKVIPHFVEQRLIHIDKAKVRKRLNLNPGRIVTLLGYIHVRKGHQLLIEALTDLPNDISVIFAGGPGSGNEAYVQTLLALAQARGVSDRLQVTGYLSESELEHYLIATDLAVCPFMFFSASGSLSTWISVVRPILAYDLPQIAEYNAIEAGAIKTFYPYDSAALAAAIKRILSNNQTAEEPSVRRLRERLLIAKIFNEHAVYYRKVAKGTAVYLK